MVRTLVLREVVGNVKQELQKYVKYLPTREGYRSVASCGYGNDQVRNVDLATIVGRRISQNSCGVKTAPKENVGD